MSDNLSVCAYWGSRVESASLCAQRLANVLERFAQVDPLLSDWMEGAYSESDARRRPIDPNVEYFETAITQNWDKQFPGLGASLGIWTDPSLAFSTICGSDARISPNNIVLRLPSPSDEGGGDRLYHPNVLRALLEVAVGECDPDWALVANYEMRVRQDERPNRKPRDPEVGWLTYLRTDISAMAASQFSGTVEVAELGDGLVLTAGSSPLQVTVEQIDAAAYVLASIFRAGDGVT